MSAHILGGSLAAHKLIGGGGATTNPYVEEVTLDYPLAWWRLEETSGSTVADEFESNNGTVFGANLATAGRVGSAASLDGVDDYIDVGTLGTFSADIDTSGCTVEFLAKWTTGAGDMLGAWNTGDGTLMFVRLNGADGTMVIRFRGATAGNQDYRNTAQTGVNDGRWHHIAFTYAGAQNAPDAYVDGALSNGASGATSNARSAFDVPLAWGALNYSGTLDRFVDADMDELALYDKVLSSERILAHAQAAGVA